MPHIPRFYHALFRLSTVHRPAARHSSQRNMTTMRRQDINHAQVTPLLKAVRHDGSEEDISEEDLYRYTRHRWVYNESYRLSERYLKFDLQQLLRAAVEVVSDKGARYCTKVLKCKEGFNNKAYLLTMDNGAEIIAKLPNPCAGPLFYTTASEVATRKFLRDVLDIPNPRILSWSTDRNNPVGSEYILEEKALGMPLWTLWQDRDEWSIEDRFRTIEQVVEIERKLASTKFMKSGCIYFKEDMPHGDVLVTDPSLCSSTLEPFRLGPLVEKGLWCGERANMNLNRGPYNGPHEFVEAMAKNEMKFIQAHGHPRMNYARSLTNPESPEEMICLLNQYLQLSPAMIPPQSVDDTLSPTLWHPDLHLNNIFVDAESKEISYLIDWQSAAALPFFYQCTVPAMFRHRGPVSSDMKTMPKRPANYHTLKQDEKEKIDNLIRSECIYKYYLAITYTRNARHGAALQLHEEVRTQPTRIVQSVWKAGDIFFLRRALMRIANEWENLSPDSSLCPITFDEQEMALQAHEEENRGHVSDILTLFRDNWELPPNGSIESSKFDEVQTRLAQMREAFVQGVDTAEDRMLAEKLWPYQDTMDNKTDS